MTKYTTHRAQRPLAAAIVVAAHLGFAWLWILVAGQPRLADQVARSLPILATIIDLPIPEPPETPAQPTLEPVMQPQLPAPDQQEIEVETLDSVTPGPDPAPSSLLVNRPAPAHDSGNGGPASGDKGLKVVRRVAAIYPRDSVLRGDAGLVQMRALVDARGRVTEVQLVRSSGFNALDTNAVRAVGKWRFEPQLQDGRHVSAWTLVNVRMSTYQQSWCRIRDEPGANGENVLDDADAATLANEATMKRLIDDLATGALPGSDALRAQLLDWGPVQSIHYETDAGYQGWVTREILPAYKGSHPGDTVQVRWDAYAVKYAQAVTRWVVATDSTGEVWCARIARTSARPG